MFEELKKFYSPYTNAFSIIKRKCLSMSKYPSASKAQELEALGISVDFDPKDAGEEPIKANYSNISNSNNNEPY